MAKTRKPIPGFKPEKPQQTGTAGSARGGSRKPRTMAARIREWMRLKEEGKAAYKAAGDLLDELVQELKADAPVDLGQGQQAVLVSQFEKKNKVYKPCGVDRLTIEIKQTA